MSGKPKKVINQADLDSMAALFESVGLDAKKAKETANGNAKFANSLREIIAESGVSEGCDKNVGVGLYGVCGRFPACALVHRPTVVKYVADGRISTHQQIEAMSVYMKKIASDPLDIAEFEKECGVGVVISEADVKTCVDAHFAELKDTLIEQRYKYPVGKLLSHVNMKLKWADGKVVMAAVTAAQTALLGPKTEADNTKPAKKKAPKEAKKKAETKAEEEPSETVANVKFNDPKDNRQLTKDILNGHLQNTGGVVVTRFPPEPNGHLHIGHAKAMNFSFSYAKRMGGYTYLRFDDTNPEKEDQTYMDSIMSSVEWLGHKPYKITHASDYFDDMYNLALGLIRKDKAYVCHQDKEAMSKGRETRTDSPWRTRSVEENLVEFERMRRGEYSEGTATLRLKMDMQNDNSVMQDLVAYRIKFLPHPKTGDKWCVYPSYDFEHCIVDSIEDITHSLCTKEFEVRRDSYFWLLDALEIYKPVVWEFSRLNITNTVMSKRRLHKLVDEGFVRGWDDPRMPTLVGMRRRGYTANSIAAFCDVIGVTRSENLIPISVLEGCVRKDLNDVAERRFAVLDPVEVTLTNWEEGKAVEVDAPNHPKDTTKGTRKLNMTRTVYLERSDIRTVDSKDFFGLAPNKVVGLKYGIHIKATEISTDADGKVLAVKAEEVPVPTTKIKGYLHWVSESKPGVAPHKFEARLYDVLFKTENLAEVAEWQKDINENSLKSLTAFCEVSVKDLPVGTAVQFERLGFFAVDPDTKDDSIVMNRTVTLKESKDKLKA